MPTFTIGSKSRILKFCAVTALLLMGKPSGAEVTVTGGMATAGADGGCSPPPPVPPTIFTPNVFYDFRTFPSNPSGNLTAQGWAISSWNIVEGEFPQISASGSSIEGFNGATCTTPEGGFGWFYARGHAFFNVVLDLDHPYLTHSTVSPSVTGVANGDGLFIAGEHSITASTLGSSGGYSLEVALSPGPLPTCADVILGGRARPVDHFIGSDHTSEIGIFKPGFNLSLDEAAKYCGYDHFNWYQEMELWPYAVQTNYPDAPFVDPPQVRRDFSPFILPGTSELADNLPYYWNEGGNHSGHYHLDQHKTMDTLLFFDRPRNSLFNPSNFGDIIWVTTSLVGINSDGLWDRLYS